MMREFASRLEGETGKTYNPQEHKIKYVLQWQLLSQSYSVIVALRTLSTWQLKLSFRHTASLLILTQKTQTHMYQMSVMRWD
jgi:hypothetical protein